ncbi:mechanosensitive ion channel family protein [Paenibacillus sp. GCM10027626]|uniref:mechanosensitive ion channel family protein n=1 Tax=Paenibacillus sp. GCM10027626 TaxID=3273411 RepID=UPI00362768C9
MTEWTMQQLEWLRWVQLLISIGILLLFLLFRKLFTNYLIAIIKRVFKQSEGILKWVEAFEKPLRAFFILIGVYLAIRCYVPEAYMATEGMRVVNGICRSIGVALVGWGIYNVSASSSALLEGLSKRFGLDETSMLIPFLSKVLRFVVIVLTVTIIGSEWGFSVNGLVAGMGLGSLAVALAAKDTLSNILGGVVIILEKPFSKGDWIMTPSVEGIVEDITFRSSKIRTFAHAVVTVPNATLASDPITNWSRMGKRRITFTLNVALNSDRERMERAIERMDQLLRNNEHIDPAMIMVRFSEFKESSLGIFFYFFTKTIVWTEYLTVKQDINLEIMRILEEEGVRLAYPAQRIFLEGAADRQQGETTGW